MNDKNYKRLGKMVTDYVMSDAFTDEELGKTIEQLFLLIAREDMRDARELANKKQGMEKPD